MSASEELIEKTGGGFLSKLPILAAAVALIGLADSVYLTVKHFTGEKVPCSIVSGCEQVLTSEYAEIFGIPTAAFGALAYFAAFSLAVMTLYGDRRMWTLFGVQTVIMLLFTIWLFYLQAFVIGAFCQFCLLSAVTTLVLFLIFIGSKFFSGR
ncbi:MAG: vitamin K epoxide reductase family protein [Pyrinomonadaceae bacterium]